MTDGRASEIALNRALWAVVNERFTDAAAEDMWVRPDVVWGLFGARERDLCVLGDVHGLDVVELACGTAYFSAWLTRAGATTVAVDLSGEQLATARRLQGLFGPVFPLVQGDAERVPLASGRFDLVVSEHGVAAWCDPERWLPEAARLLRPGGRLVFLTNSHLSALCVPAEEGVAGERLLRGQREAYRVHWPGGGIEFHPSHGDWVRLLRRSGFVVEAMHEIYAPADGGDHPFYEIVSTRVGDQVAGRGALGGRPPMSRGGRSSSRGKRFSGALLVQRRVESGGAEHQSSRDVEPEQDGGDHAEYAVQLGRVRQLGTEVEHREDMQSLESQSDHGRARHQAHPADVVVGKLAGGEEPDRERDDDQRQSGRDADSWKLHTQPAHRGHRRDEGQRGAGKGQRRNEPLRTRGGGTPHTAAWTRMSAFAPR